MQCGWGLSPHEQSQSRKQPSPQPSPRKSGARERSPRATRMNIYLAGPDVFLPDAVEIGRRKLDICARYGLTGLYPLDSAVDPAAADLSLRIFGALEVMMERCDAIIANLTPFRGAGADPGTVYELGYMAARGKFCLGYSNDPAIYVERVRRFTTVVSRDGRLVDEDGLMVEDFGHNDNLMMVHGL